MSDAEEWISSLEAIGLLRPQLPGLSSKAICKRAYAGLVKTKAERLISGKAVKDNVELPEGFWWAEGEAALGQNWVTGDFDTWIEDILHMQAFGVMFRKRDIEKMKGSTQNKVWPINQQDHATGHSGTIFLGHGQSPVWRELQIFLEKRLRLLVEEFNSIPTAGIPTVQRLEVMLKNASFAFLVLTAEDEHNDRKIHARMNVVHEVGLFQGRLGFQKAIVLLEDGCEEFSNIHGLGQIRFLPGKISTVFEQIREVLEREKLIP